tara:strand:- start:1555 stop:1851 length:297 start_codon:yes stop_codon:yes gene_type:complete
MQVSNFAPAGTFTKAVSISEVIAGVMATAHQRMNKAGLKSGSNADDAAFEDAMYDYIKRSNTELAQELEVAEEFSASAQRIAHMRILETMAKLDTTAV